MAKKKNVALADLPARGIWLFREHFYSICSRHAIHDPDCDLCTTGHWHRDVSTSLSQRVFKLFPDLWRKWANRPAAKEKFLRFETYCGRDREVHSETISAKD